MGEADDDGAAADDDDDGGGGDDDDADDDGGGDDDADDDADVDTLKVKCLNSLCQESTSFTFSIIEPNSCFSFGVAMKPCTNSARSRSKSGLKEQDERDDDDEPRKSLFHNDCCNAIQNKIVRRLTRPDSKQMFKKS